MNVVCMIDNIDTHVIDGGRCGAKMFLVSDQALTEQSATRRGRISQIVFQNQFFSEKSELTW